MSADATMEALEAKVWDGERVNPAETAQLYQLPLEQLGSLAHRRRQLAKARGLTGASR